MEEVSKNILKKENESRLLTIGSSPHIRSNNSTFKIMLNVIIALTPAALFSVYLFGIKALLLILVSAASAVISEYSYEKLLGKELTVRDLSAIITGILIAFNVPIGFPLWKLIFGNVFAIVIVKQLPHTKFKGEVYVLKKEEGGKHTPFFNGYRPQFYFKTTDGREIGRASCRERV